MITNIANDVKLITIKIGSSLLVSKNDNGGYFFNAEWLRSVAEDIFNLKKSGKKVCIVTSGAIASAKLLFENEDNDIFDKTFTTKQKQSLAAIGQIELMKNYMRIFNEFNLKVGQVLISKDDILNSKRKLNIQNTIFTMINDFDVIPIVNENDTVNFEQIKFGDNDTLSAHFCNIIGSDLLVILSDIDGLYDKNPKIFNDAKLIESVSVINSKIIKMAGGVISKTGTGGMITKLQAAKIILKNKSTMILKSGKDLNPLSLKQLKNTKNFTTFSKKAKS